VISEGSLANPAPPVALAEAVRLSRALYGLGSGADVRATALPGEYDSNFEIITGDGSRYVLKVMHPGRDRSLVDLQIMALEHLANTRPDLPLPRVRKARSGEAVTSLSMPGTEEKSRVDRLVWMLTFIEGAPLAKAKPWTDEMLESLGRFLGALDRGLEGFAHPASERDFKWDLARAGWIEESLSHIDDADSRDLVAQALARFNAEVVPVLPSLPKSVIHGDANDHNVIVKPAEASPRVVASVIDFGDMHLGITVAEVAVGAAYAIFGRKDKLRAAAHVVRGYHMERPLSAAEVGVLFPLILARLAVSVTNSAIRKETRPHDPYVTVSEESAWEALAALLKIPPALALATFRQACGLSVVERSAEVVAWLQANADKLAPILDSDLRTEPCVVFDLSVSSPLLGADPQATLTPVLTGTLFGEMARHGVKVGVGRYDEARLLYVSPLFAEGEAPTDERRTVHLGVDLFVEAGSRVYAPLPGVVHLLVNNNAPQDYGPLLVLKHQTDDGIPFFTLYGHLSEDTLTRLKVGQQVAEFDEIARVGSPPTNGDWAPHLHFQIILDFLGLDAAFPGVCRASERELWKALSPDPNPILGIPQERFGPLRESSETTLAKRRRFLGGNLSLSYERPVELVRGFGAYMYDPTGRAFLDMYNNVPLVGHSHPAVVRATQAQLGLLNTNTRYLHDNVVRYAERLTALMPEPLRVCYFVNSGSEANDLALRMARTHTCQRDLIVLENAYHGHTGALIEVSPYKFNGPGGAGAGHLVHVAPMPDDYRGPFRRDDPEAGVKYGRAVGHLVSRLRKAGRRPAAFMAETLPSVGGQIVPPKGFLAEAYSHVREAGGLCIADEVQAGFGRVGTHFWGFEMQQVVPDIVVLGKPIGNGFPLGAVITTQAIADSFANGMEFFSTFGGNPVASAAGLAVLDVMRDEGLQERALEVGNQLIAVLRMMAEEHKIIGDVRGSGLFLGVELVKDRATREPARAEAKYVVNRLRDLGVLTGTDGPYENVIKLRPPLVLTQDDADLFLSAFDQVLREDRVRVS
jgi:4-aminobutyrate aminotransferase-like enzyme/Ser/Thr protein kinase RdoA (MazF antagonist)